MPRAVVDDGVGLEYLDVGDGTPIVWVHEASGDMNSWMPQVHFFSRRFRVITFNTRGYPPSDVPTEQSAYSQERHAQDVAGLLKHLGLKDAYVGGQSMGGTTAMQFGLMFPEMARGIIIASGGAGSVNFEAAREAMLGRANDIEKDPAALMRHYGDSGGRYRLKLKDPITYEDFEEKLAGHSTLGAHLTIRGVQLKRPPVFQLEDRLKAMDVPTLILVGDEDDGCIEPGIYLKRTIPRAGLVMFPQTGHTINLEEPALFNQVVLDFINSVEAGTWVPRGPKPRF